MIRRKLAIILLSILLISTISTKVFAQSTQSDESTSFSHPNVSMSNATIANTSPKLPPLEIPSSNATHDVSRVIPPPPTDWTKVKPVNMTEVKARMALYPVHDENFMVPITNSTQREQTLQSDDTNTAQYATIFPWYNQYLYNIQGLYATQWLDTSFTIDSNAILYGPTLKVPTPCPLEVTTVYSGWYDEYFIGVWDHTLGSFTQRIYFSEEQDYIIPWDQYELYTVAICKNQNNEWAALLWNYATWQYDEIYTQANEGGPYPDGWDSYEAKWSSGTNWPPTINTRSEHLMVYYYDLVLGWRWVSNNYMSGFSYNYDVNVGALEASGNYRDWLSLWDDWTAGAHYVETITYCGPISGGGNAWDGAKLRGCKNDDQFARIYAGNRGDAGGITARMIRGTYGHIYVNAYSAYGYYKSHLYVFVSQDGQNWTPLNGGNPITINYWDGRKDFYCGYSGGFSHIAFAGYDDNGFSVNLYLDHVFVYH